MRWETDEKRELALRWGSNQTSARIAVSLGRARHAVMGQIDRMGLMGKKGDAAAALDAVFKLDHPSEPQAMRPRTPPWTADADEEIRLRWAMGLPPARIGAELHPPRQEDAVLRRARKLGLPSDPGDLTILPEAASNDYGSFRDHPLVQRVLAVAPPTGTTWSNEGIDDFCTMLGVAMSHLTRQHAAL